MAIIFYKVQSYKEVTRGTAAAATAKLMAYHLRPKVGDRSIVQPVEDRGSKFGAFRGFSVRKQADMGNLETGDSGLTFEDVLYPLLMAVKGGVTPTTPDPTNAASGRLWTFTPTSGSADNPDTFTIEWGDDVQAWESEYCFGTGLTISGRVNEAWALSMPMVGRQHTAGEFTGALSDRTVESVITNLSKLYMDDSGGTIGTTQISSAFVGFEWNLGDHFYPVFTGDGNYYFTTHAEKKVFPKLNLDIIVDSTTKALITTKYTTPTVQLVRVDGLGTLIGGTIYNRVQIDGAYRIMDISSLEEEDGLSRVRMSLAAEYDSTYAKMYEISAQNTIATLP